MKEIIQEALREANKMLIRKFPVNKTINESCIITGMTLEQVTAYCPNAPATAYLTTREDENEVLLMWEKKIPVTGTDLAKFKQKRFPSIAWQYVYNALTAAGYKRVGFCSSLLKPFDGISLYDKFLEDDFDFFVRFYSFRFKKEVKKVWKNC